jgi:hypothetical protein
MTEAPEFVEFPKIARWSREVIVTEKIDGTNAQVHITEDGRIFSGSRTRWVVPPDDNFGWGRWVLENAEELRKLGPGSHFGEWWGQGIQRKYGMAEKRFSLFNTSRWSDQAVRPACCHVVPEIWRGPMDALNAKLLLQDLEAGGSRAAPGFMKPEGIVIFHPASGQLFKKTIEKDEQPKGLAR